MGPHRRISLRLATLAVCVLAACSDRAPLPSGPELKPAATAIHGELPAPALTSTVTGNDVLLTWSWSDTQDWAFVTFSLSEAAEVLDAGKVRPYTAGYVYTASWTAYDVSSGSHVYCVKVTAKSEHVKKVRSVTSHSLTCDTVTVP